MGDILIEEKYITEIDFTKALARRLKTTFVDLGSARIDPSAVHLVDEDLARKNDVIAIDRKNGALIVAMSNPMNFHIIEEVRIEAGMEVVPVIATASGIRESIGKYYADKVTHEAAQDVNKEFKEAVTQDVSTIDTSIDERVDSAPVVRLVNSIIEQAVKLNASDIHIEPCRENTRVRMRVDGNLQDVLTLSAGAHASIVTRIKIMASMDIAERRLPLDGRCEADAGGEKIDLRISTLPTVYGEKAVIRLLTNNFLKTQSGAYSLGLSQENMRLFDKLVRVAHGIILVTGPTGSGKTTTLYTMIGEIMTPQLNVVTIEDPVEFKIDGANQMQINNRAGLTFASGLRSILRQDPDIIMVGEIRDSETAQIAVRASITGHLVLSTLHTNDAASTVGRLIDMGAEPYLVASALSGVIAQRLVRKICPYCKREHPSTPAENLMLGLTETATLYEGAGCARCNFTGYLGRKAIHEILLVDEGMQEIISSRRPSRQIEEYAEKNGMVTLKQDMLRNVLAGESTVSEYVKAVYTV
ncbi:type II secretion system protein E [Christensenellaceae bacterium]|nr:type II secretion system protein E [Christensenellaceae bacterium]BDF60608.1 type II secretion system protein E [Christensenellaceae bacterium]